MRHMMVLGASLLALAACQKKDEAAKPGETVPAAASAPAAPVGPPKRKAGLWSQTISTGGMTQATKICLDADTDAKMTAWGQAVGKDTCSRNAISATPGGWAFESECDMGSGGKTVTKGSATGDFNSKYVVKATTTTTGAAMAQANGVHEMELTAVWEGACPANMKPGDVALPGGMTINMETLTAGK